MMTIYPFIGMKIGFELTEGLQNDKLINYLLLDFFVMRLQFAWYAE